MNQQYFIMMNKKAAELKIQQLNEEGIFKTNHHTSSSLQKLLSSGRLPSRLL